MTTTIKHVRVYGYGNGGHKSYETFRVSWSAVGDAAELDFRTREARQLVAQGLAGVRYVRGAWARQCAVSSAHVAVVEAQRSVSAIAA